MGSKVVSIGYKKSIAGQLDMMITLLHQQLLFS
jgi:hypothetical protein